MLTEGGSTGGVGAAEGRASSETAGLAEPAEAASSRVANNATKPPMRKAAIPTITHSRSPLLEGAAAGGLRLAIWRRSSSICRRSRMTTVFSVRSERFFVDLSAGIFGADGGLEPGAGCSEITIERASSVTCARGLGTCAPCCWAMMASSPSSSSCSRSSAPGRPEPPEACGGTRLTRRYIPRSPQERKAGTS